MLLRLLDVAKAAMVKEVRFGLRQQLLVDVPEKHFRAFQRNCEAENITYHLFNY